MKKMLVVDGNSILNRAFYGIRLLTNQEGLYTNAVYGMITMLWRHLEQLKPDYCAVAFDLKTPTFRHRLYDGYKANRKGMPEELAVQLPYAKECMEHMGLHVVTCEGYEADDILGTFASKIGTEEVHVYVLTGDRDSLQLIGDHVSVMLVKTKETLLFDREEFHRQYGLDPSLFVEVKALMGDSSDNIPGVLGIGEKTALKLVAENGTVEQLYENLDTVKISDGVKTKLQNGKEMAFLSRTLSEICCEAPISTELSAYEYSGHHATELRRLFIQLNFTALIKKFGLEDEQVEQEVTKSSCECSDAFCYVKGDLSDLREDIIYISVEDDSLILFDGCHLCESALDEQSVQEIQELLSAKKTVCHDYKSLYKQLQKHGLELPICYFDCMLAAYVLDSARSKYTMEELSIGYLKKPMPADQPRAVLLKELYEVLHQEIANGGFHSLLTDIELPLTRVLAEMELTGFHVDCDGITAYGQELGEVAEILQQRIYSYAGEVFNIGSPKQLGEVLFDKMGLPKARKTKTGYSTDAETLQKLIGRHPIIEDILDYRQVTKLKSTYADSLPKAADENGRIHSAFNQTGTATGRLSSSEPNLQNIPVRTELGRRFRQFFIPQNSDYVLIDADYSQIELRLLAHIANDTALIEAFRTGEDIHVMTAARVFHVAPDEVTPDLRKKAKAVNFGIMYGIGEYSLSEDLGISRAEAKAYIESYFAQFPDVRAYLDRVQEEAKRDGFVTTYFGRRRYIPELSSSNRNLQHFGQRIAMNSPIQGTAADIIKIAMIRVSERLRDEKLDARMILQVHDELLIEAHRSCAEAVRALLVESMENAVSLSVPLSVEAQIGENWLAAK